MIRGWSGLHFKDTGTTELTARQNHSCIFSPHSRIPNRFEGGAKKYENSKEQIFKARTSGSGGDTANRPREVKPQNE